MRSTHSRFLSLTSLFVAIFVLLMASDSAAFSQEKPAPKVEEKDPKVKAREDAQKAVKSALVELQKADKAVQAAKAELEKADKALTKATKAKNDKDIAKATEQKEAAQGKLDTTIDTANTAIKAWKEYNLTLVDAEVDCLAFGAPNTIAVRKLQIVKLSDNSRADMADNTYPALRQPFTWCDVFVDADGNGLATKQMKLVIVKPYDASKGTYGPARFADSTLLENGSSHKTDSQGLAFVIR